MFSLIKQVLIVLLSFSRSLPIKCVSSNNESRMIRLCLIDLNLLECKYYPSMISLDKYSGSSNSVDDLSTKICVPNKTKDINVTMFNMITKKNEAKKMVKHISCDCKCKFNSLSCSSNQKWNNETCQSDRTNYGTCKKIIVGILAYVFVRMVSIQKVLLMIQKLCVMKLYVMDVVSTNVANTISTNVTKCYY